MCVQKRRGTKEGGDSGCRGGGRRHKAAEEEVGITVEVILEAVRVRRRQESDRRDGSEGGLEGGRIGSEEYGRVRRHRYAGTETGDAQAGR